MNLESVAIWPSGRRSQGRNTAWFDFRGYTVVPLWIESLVTIIFG